MYKPYFKFHAFWDYTLSILTSNLIVSHKERWHSVPRSLLYRDHQGNLVVDWEIFSVGSCIQIFVSSLAGGDTLLGRTLKVYSLTPILVHTLCHPCVHRDMISQLPAPVFMPSACCYTAPPHDVFLSLSNCKTKQNLSSVSCFLSW